MKGTNEEKEDSKVLSEISNTLKERGERYGSFRDHSTISQELKEVISSHLNARSKILSYPHQEALEMILHKIARIINGDPNYKDSWHDIAGYATLAEEECVKTYNT